MGTRDRLLRNYPDLYNQTLPVIIACLDEHDLDEVKKGFQRVCFKDVGIIELEGVRSNHPPVCIWRVHYELKHKDIELQEMKDIPAPNLPKNDALKKLFEDITMKCAYLGMKVVRKYKGKNNCTAIVEYSSIECQCASENFKMATEVPCRWPNITEEIQKVEGTLLEMRM